jgi:phosphoribosylaminoimidazolecarboxamide formyltransferase/IMP cyclohydrolase
MPSDPRPVSRALLSVSDKTGLVPFARSLVRAGVELVSTGGTRAALVEAGLAVGEVSDLTGFPEMMDGRVKTLHPAVHGGLLAVRSNPEHQAAMLAHGIGGIDLLVVNLYPFEATVAVGRPYEECIETIDIGGPAMIRAAAKNHVDVAVVVDPADYEAVLADLERHEAVTLALRRRLAQKAYARTAAYDAAISNWFASELGTPSPDYRALGGSLPRGDAVRREPAPIRRLLPDRGSAAGCGRQPDRPAASSSPSTTSTTRTPRTSAWQSSTPPARPQSRSSSTPIPAGRGGATLADAHAKALRCDPVSGLRRDRGAEPDARRRGGPTHRRGVHGSHHRAGRDGGGDRDRRRERRTSAFCSRARSRTRAGRAWRSARLREAS